MKPDNYFDDIIHQQLNDFPSEVPDYIWDNIERKRGRKHRLLAFFRTRWLGMGLLFTLTGIFSATLYTQFKDVPSEAVTLTTTTLLTDELNNKSSQDFTKNVYSDLVADQAKKESGFRFQGSGVRGQESGVKNQGSGFRGQESGFRGQESGEKRSERKKAISKNQQTINSQQIGTFNQSLSDATTSTYLTIDNRQYADLGDSFPVQVSDFVKKRRDVTAPIETAVRPEFTPDYHTFTKQNITTNKDQHLALTGNDNYPSPVTHYQPTSINQQSQNRDYPSPDTRHQSAVSQLTDTPLKYARQTQLLDKVPLIEGMAEMGFAHQQPNNKQLKKRKPADYCISMNKFKRHIGFSVELTLSPDFLSKTLTAKSEETQAYRDRRAETESTKVGFTGGLRVGYTAKSGLQLKSGLNYSLINETFDYVVEEERNIFWITETPLPPDPVTGDSLVLIDTVRAVVIGEKLSRTYNRYRFVDIPILIGYQIPAEHFDISFTGGVLLNMTFRKRGKILDPTTLEPTPLTNSTSSTGDAKIFKLQSGLSLYGGIGYYYHITDKIQFLAEPHIKYLLKSITDPEHPVEQKHLIFGINTGIKFNF